MCWAEQQLELIDDSHGTFYYEQIAGGQLNRVDARDRFTNEAALKDDPLLFAIATKRDPKTIQTFITATHGQVDSEDDLGRTAVQYAVIAERADVVKLICQAGGDTNKADVQGHTPLLWAAYRGLHEIMAILLKYGATVETPDSQGRTPIHWSTRLETTKCLKVLVDHCVSKGGESYAINIQVGSYPFKAI